VNLDIPDIKIPPISVNNRILKYRPKLFNDNDNTIISDYVFLKNEEPDKSNQIEKTLEKEKY